MPEKYSFTFRAYIVKCMFPLFRTAVIRRLAGDCNIMRMAFKHAGISDTGKFGIVRLSILAAPQYPIPARKPPVNW